MQKRKAGNVKEFIGASANTKLNEGIDQNFETAKKATKPLKTPESIEIEEFMMENNGNTKWPLNTYCKRKTFITNNFRKETQSNTKPSNKRKSSIHDRNNNSNRTENAGTEL